jgi:L-ascorbate metabolism protein UlaG (beta-lactamase superfamily)
LEGATGAYAHLDAILITHRHADHFQAAAVAARLAVDLHVRVIAPSEVLDSLTAFAPVLRGDPRLQVAVPGATITIGSASVLTLDLPHNRTASRRAQNVGYLIAIDGVRVLHVGDADPDANQMRSAHGSTPRADVAIVPFWYLISTKPSLMQAIGATRYLAAHIPLADTATVKRQVSSSPSVTPLSTRGTTIALSPRQAR